MLFFREFIPKHVIECNTHYTHTREHVHRYDFAVANL